MINQSMTVEEAIHLIFNKIEEIDNFRVYYCLKKMKIRYINDLTVENVKICIALYEFGLNISSILFSRIKGQVRYANSVITLHSLGDKKIITLIRDDNKTGNLQWILSDIFSNLYYNKNNEGK